LENISGKDKGPGAAGYITDYLLNK